MSRKADEQYRVIAFTANGENHTGHDIDNISGFVRSDITGRDFPLFVFVGGRRVSPSDVINIPDGANFAFEAPFGPPEGIPWPKFITEIGGITFVFVRDGQKYLRDFATNEIVYFIKEQEKSSGYKTLPPPIVMK